MPRDGSGNYSIPPGTEGFPDTTIESAKYNIFIADVETDLNAPRPISAGGTGASNERDAAIAMGTEYADQVVDNYDMYPFVSGSFSSAAGATAAPVTGHAFTGQAVIHDDPLFATLTAHDLGDTAVPGRNYIREKKAGVWSAWKVDGRTIIGDAEGIAGEGADMFFGVEGAPPTSAFVVNTESDNTGVDILRAVKSGNVELRSLPAAWTVLGLHKSGVAMSAGFAGYDHTGKARWSMYLGDNSAEGGADAGSNFAIYRYNDAGDPIPGAAALSIQRSNGQTAVKGELYAGASVTVTGAVRAGAEGAGGAYYFGNGGTNLSFDGAHFITSAGFLVSGNAYANGDAYIGYNQASYATLRFTSSGTSRYLHHNGTQFILNGGNLNVTSGVIADGQVVIGSGVLRWTNASSNNYIWYDGTNTQLRGGALKIGTGGIDTNGQSNINGGMSIWPSGGFGAPLSNFLLQHGVQPTIGFYAPGYFACNFGMSTNGRFYMGGSSYGADTAYQFWTSAEFSSVVASVRTTHVGDYSHNYPNGIEEPFGSSAVLTGFSMGYSNAVIRYRQLQQLINGAWGNIGAT